MGVAVCSTERCTNVGAAGVKTAAAAFYGTHPVLTSLCSHSFFPTNAADSSHSVGVGGGISWAYNVYDLCHKILLNSVDIGSTVAI